MDLKLKGKKVLVTGGTYGIGRSIAECFAEEGCNVSICARDQEKVKKTVLSLSDKKIKAMGHAFDISNFEALERWIKESANVFEGIDIYISNVSAQSFDWNESFKIDIMGCVKGIETALPFLKKAPESSIVAVASKAAMLSVPSYKPYSAMKAALISYISSLSRELAPIGIRANSVSPGEIYISGGFWDRIKNEDNRLYQETLRNNPFGRFGNPEEVAKGVVFLASPAASFISGTNLMIDGAGKDYVQY